MGLLNGTSFKRLKFRLSFIFVLLLVLSTTSTHICNFSNKNSAIKIDENNIQNEINGNASNNFSQQAIDNSENPNNFSKITDWGKEFFIVAKSVEIIGNCALFLGQSGLVSIDITNISDPTICYKTEHSEVSNLVKFIIDDDLIYLGFSKYGMGEGRMQKIEIFNISDPFEPFYVASYFHYGIQDFFVNSSIMLIYSYYDDLLIIDFSDLGNINQIGHLEDTINGYEMEVEGNFVYISDNSYLMTIVDISNLTNPNIVNTIIWPFDYSYYSFFINKNLLYIADHENLTIYEISNPTNPLFLGKVDHQVNNGKIIGYNNGYLYLTPSYYYDLVVLDVRNPNNPFYLEKISTHIQDAFDFYDIDFNNDLIILTCGRDGILFGNITNDYDFMEITRLRENYCKSSLIYKDSLFVSGNKKISILNVSDYDDISVINEYQLQYDFEDIFIEFNRCYVLTEANIEILNITDLTNIIKLGEFNIQSYSGCCLLVNNSIIFIGYKDLFIYNATDATNVVLIYNTDYDNYAIFSIQLYGDYLIIAWYYYGYFVFDVSNLQSISMISNIDTGRDVKEFVIENGLLYSIEDYVRIYIYNISDIQNFELLSYSIQYSYGRILDLVVMNESVYYLNCYNAIEFGLVDTSNQTNVELKPLYLSDEQDIYFNGIYHFATKNGTVFVPLLEYGLLILGEDHDSDKIPTYLEIEIFKTNPNSIDSDADLMDDYFEIKNNLDPLNDSDAILDFDSDSLTNLEESIININPNHPDSDRDTLLDNQELNNYYTDPATIDTDGDGLVDPFEILTYLTDPLLQDTDNDSLSDFSEIFSFGTNPLNNDSDGDLMDDYYEVHYQLNPLDQSDAEGDLDLDGLTNYEEFLLGTRPNDSDSDNDDYSDFEEVQEGTDPNDPYDYPDYEHTQLTTKLPIPTVIIIPIAFVFMRMILYLKTWRRK